MLRRLVVAAAMFAVTTATADAQANGNLQIHFMHVGQGDGAVLISPQGEVVLFDNGVRNECDLPRDYLRNLGVQRIDYHVASHYHDDHIGCTKDVLGEFPLQNKAYDRGGSYHTVTFDKYVTAVGGKRTTAEPGMTVTLDEGSEHPTVIEFVALNGDGVQTTNENDLSLVAVVRFGDLDVEIGGDLSGFESDSYEDIETSVAPKVGQIEVYKVHHHGSRYSTNDGWLLETKPIVGIVSAGENNKHGHPTPECLERLHGAGVKTYWTSLGSGAVELEEGELDVLAGDIVVEIEPAAATFSVSYLAGGTTMQTDSYLVWESAAPPAIDYAWSEQSQLYHHVNCRYVANIKPENLRRGDTPPAGKQLHTGCPK